MGLIDQDPIIMERTCLTNDLARYLEEAPRMVIVSLLVQVFT
jgi:hypothetical protein